MNDIISRQAAIDALKTCQTYVFDKRDPDNKISLESAEYEIEQLPSAQPERKTGRWIRITQGAMPEQYICPFCHRIIESYGVEELLSIRYPYCHCGADMRGEHDGNQEERS